METHMLTYRLSRFASLIACILMLPLLSEARIVSSYVKKDIMRRSKVWHEVDVASMDMLNGPQGEGSYKFNQKVPCKYEEKDPRNPLGGHSPKFPCWDKAGNRLKVKYNNTEVYGEVAATRLFWALGFYAERMYAVQIVCENCPKDPWKDKGDQKRATRTFKQATVQKRLQGEEISVNKWEGWSYDELELIDDRRGGSTRAEVDALKLLSVFVNHVDNTLNQQRILHKPERKVRRVHDLSEY